jgi:hypothetical protein
MVEEVKAQGKGNCGPGGMLGEMNDELLFFFLLLVFLFNNECWLGREDDSLLFFFLLLIIIFCNCGLF